MEERINYVAHCLVLPYPAQGHINPMLEFSKRLIQRGVKVTLVTVVSNWKVVSRKNFTSIEVESISDGYDEGGLAAAESLEVYLETFCRVGAQTLAELLQKLAGSSHPPDCVIYDGFMLWALDVAKKFGLLAAAFFTQSCTTNTIYLHTYNKLLELPLTQTEYLLPGLPKLEAEDLPSFLNRYGTYPGYFYVVVNQLSNIDKADWVLANTFYDMEREVSEFTKKGLIVNWCPQLQVLTHEALGCFITHCGWNSTLEALSLGVPVIAMPLWTDQITNAKLIKDVWKIGVKAVADEKDIVRKETITHCIKEILETEKGNEIKKNSIKWKNLAKSSVDEGGSSDKNTAEFVNELVHRRAALN
ncbi:UDP-glycosyltransferase 74G1-like [Vigna umbellata]|uniref:UDP-glycosyltransferase 74G1-like n=1 Tax=Vigna umbellata TaxID=87088 RepID=UPI001F5FC56F|nr:UDP-glycosyltransferase 74G1-like [Vigna umbellata]